MMLSVLHPNSKTATRVNQADDCFRPIPAVHMQWRILHCSAEKQSFAVNTFRSYGLTSEIRTKHKFTAVAERIRFCHPIRLFCHPTRFNRFSSDNALVHVPTLVYRDDSFWGWGALLSTPAIVGLVCDTDLSDLINPCHPHAHPELQPTFASYDLFRLLSLNSHI